MHAGDEFKLRLAVVGRDVRVGQRAAQRRRVRRECQATVGLCTQAFFFEAATHATQAMARDGFQPLLD